MWLYSPPSIKGGRRICILKNKQKRLSLPLHPLLLGLTRFILKEAKKQETKRGAVTGPWKADVHQGPDTDQYHSELISTWPSATVKSNSAASKDGLRNTQCCGDKDAPEPVTDTEGDPVWRSVISNTLPLFGSVKKNLLLKNNLKNPYLRFLQLKFKSGEWLPHKEHI